MEDYDSFLSECHCPTYSTVSKLLGAEIRYYDLEAENGWLPDLEVLEQQDLSRVKIMWINYPHMPTGILPTKKLFQDLVKFAKKHSILLCHDNPYSLILNDAPMSILSVKGADEVVLELNSLSKSHNMLGWRIGLVAGRKEYISTIPRVKSNFDSGMFVGLQEAAIAALKNTEAWHRENDEVYRRRRELVSQILKTIGCTFEPGQAGMYIWAIIPDDIESGAELVDDLLQKAHVFITPGFIFGTNGSRYVRASLCVLGPRLKEALKRMIGGPIFDIDRSLISQPKKILSGTEDPNRTRQTLCQSLCP